MVEGHEIVPLQYRVRHNLFEQWLRIMNNYEEYQRIKRLGSEDTKSKSAIVAGVKKIIFELNNYSVVGDVRLDKMEEIEVALRIVSKQLFNLGVIDARMDKPENTFIIDW